MLLHTTRTCCQVDLVEVQCDVRARVLAVTLRIIKLLMIVILHVLAAAARARLEVVRLVA